MRVVFMGTPHFAVPALKALMASHHEMVGVYSQPPRPAGRGMKLTPSPVHELAETHGIPVFTPTSLKSAEAQEQLRALHADVAVVAAYGLLLPQPILDAPKHGCINIHPSDLPRWRGAAPLQRTIMAGDTTTACCIMQMDAGLDTGPVLLRRPSAVPAGMNTGQLHDAMAETGAQMVLAVLGMFENGTAKAVPQATEGATYAAKLTKADQWLDFSQPAAMVLQQLLGLTPMPAGLVQLNGETCKVFAAHPEAGDAAKPAGICLDERLLINCADGMALRIDELQRPNKSRQFAGQLLARWPVAAGTYAQSLHSAG